MACRTRGAPICFHTAPLIGVSGPITLAGLLALYNAEVLSGIIISQLIHPGAPVIYGGGWGTFDLRGANRVLGAPEAALQVIAGTQLARAYNIPCHAIGPDTDAHGPDEQTGWEKMLKAVCAIQAGVSLFVNAGMFDTGMTVSCEQLILDNEILELAFRFAEGIAVNADTLALDVIRHVGPGGDYLSEDHTLRYLRSGEHWDPTVSNRNSFPQWEEMGSPSVLERAHERAEAILNSHQPPEPDPAKRRELTRLIQAFEREYGKGESAL
jgi:trimethylamine--corrinoid protein Co-methyltransferase